MKKVGLDTAERRVVIKYRKLHKALVELANSLQSLEPGGTLIDDVLFVEKDTGVQVGYKARPVKLTIVDGKRKFTLNMTELNHNLIKKV